MGEVGSLGCVSFLLEGTGACVLVGGAGSCLSGGQGRIWWCALGYLELNMILGSLSVNGWVCVPVLLVVWHGAFSSGACWPLGGAGS